MVNQTDIKDCSDCMNVDNTFPRKACYKCEWNFLCFELDRFEKNKESRL